MLGGGLALRRAEQQIRQVLAVQALGVVPTAGGEQPDRLGQLAQQGIEQSDPMVVRRQHQQPPELALAGHDTSAARF